MKCQDHPVLQEEGGVLQEVHDRVRVGGKIRVGQGQAKITGWGSFEDKTLKERSLVLPYGFQNEAAGRQAQGVPLSDILDEQRQFAKRRRNETKQIEQQHQHHLLFSMVFLECPLLVVTCFSYQGYVYGWLVFEAQLLLQ